MGKMVLGALADDSPNQPAVKLTPGQAGVAETLNREFTAPGGPGYRPVGTGLSRLGQPITQVGGAYRQRLVALADRMNQAASQPLPGSTAQLPSRTM
jgi:hypothetical protein